MFGKKYVGQLIDRSAETPADRRRFMKTASAAGLGLVGASFIAGMDATSASASTDANSISDGTILNFALNLEYLEAEFYSHAVYGSGLPSNLTGGKGNRGGVEGGRAVPFKTKAIKAVRHRDRQGRIRPRPVPARRAGRCRRGPPGDQPQQQLHRGRHAAGLIKRGQTFDVYANEDNFLLGAFIFEDVGVTAYKGAAPLISNKTYLGAAAGILAVEAYHAATIRTVLYERGLAAAANAISAARDTLDNTYNDQGITLNGQANIVPADANGIAFGRTPARC